MTNPFTDLKVLPGYDAGFAYAWRVSEGLEDPGPWQFTMEESVTAPDDFHAISPVLTDKYVWHDGTRRIPAKESSLYYRVKLVTSTATYYSSAVGPWGDLARRDYLLIKEMMRKEVLHARTLAGTLCSLWVKNVYGPKCPVCLDPITGTVRNSKCPACMGTGYAPPYHGPYGFWMTFSPTNAKLDFTEDGAGTVQDSPYTIRMIGGLTVRKGDVVVDPRSDIRYVILASQDIAELRRVSTVQQLAAQEIPTTDIIYKLTANIK